MRFEIEKDGQRYEVEAPSMEAAAKALSGGGQQAAPDQGKKTYEWSDLPSNILPSAANAAEGLYNTVMHPLDTGQNLYNLGLSGIYDIYKDRITHPRTTLLSDPVGSMLDLSTLATLGGTGAEAAAARLGSVGGKLAKAGAIASKVGEISDLPFQAARLAAKIPGKASYIGTQIGGMTTLTGGAPELGRQAGKLGGKEQQLFSDSLSGKAPEDTMEKMVQKGRDEFMKKAQDDLNAAYAPLKADRSLVSGGINARLKVALDKAKDQAYYAGKGKGNQAAAKVYNEILNGNGTAENPGLKAWLNPPAVGKLTAATKYAPKELAAKIIGRNGERSVVDVGGDPTTMTSAQYLKAWADKHRTFEGLDELKKMVEGVYEGYKIDKGAPDRRAATVASTITDAVKDIIKTHTAPKYGATYENAQKAYGDMFSKLKSFDRSFGTNIDTRTRRLTAINRDGVFTNFRLRLKLLRDIQEHAPSMQGVEFAGAGAHLRTWQPRNMISGVGSIASAGYITGSLTSPLALVLIGLHVPHIVGKTANLLGKTERWIGKPAKLVAQAMQRVGITPHGAALTGQQVGLQAQRSSNKEQFKNALRAEAAKLGYNIHDRVLDNAANSLLSEDLDTFMRGLKTVSGHKRLMHLISSMAGTKGEQ